MVGSSSLEHWVMTKAKGILLSLFLAHLFGNVRCEIGDCQPLMWCSTNKNGLTSNTATTSLPSVSSNRIDGRIVIDTSHHGEAGAPKTVVVPNPGRISCCVLGGRRGRLMREKTTGFRGGEVWKSGNVGELSCFEKRKKKLPFCFAILGDGWWW